MTMANDASRRRHVTNTAAVFHYTVDGEFKQKSTNNVPM